MKLFITISILFFSLFANAQVMVLGVKVPEPAAPSGTQRILIDFGGDGSADNGNTDTGVETPSNSIGSGNVNGRTGQASDGNWWNNIVDCRAGTWITDPVDINNTTVTGFSISASAKPGGTFVVGDYSMNFGGTASAVNDYPATAVQDNCYFYDNTVTTNLTVIIPAGKTATIKWWGNRAASGPRILQIKKSTDGSFTQEFDAANNVTYSSAATFTGLTGTVVFNCKVKAGSTFGHLSVMDITLE